MTPESTDTQAGKPTGLLGRIFGEIMALTNQEMNLFALRSMAVASEDAVLEIGFGPGKLLAELVRCARSVDGIDLSEVMVEAATQRNSTALAAGRLRVHNGSVEHLPFADGAFDVVCAVNTFQFWPRPVENVKEVRRVLRRDGRLVLVLRQGPGSLPFGFGGLGEPQRIELALQVLKQAGFHNVRGISETLRLVTATSILGEVA